MPHKLFLVKKTSKKSKLRNAFANNISTYIKISKAQLSKIIQLGGCFGNMIANLDKKALKDLVVLSAKDVLAKLATKAASSVIDKFGRKTSRRGAVRAGKRFTLFISNENLDDIMKIVRSIEISILLIDGATKTVKHEKK